MEFETDKWTIQRSEIDGIGVFLLADVSRGECLGMAHMLHPESKNILAYYNSLGRFHNHSTTPNFVARVEGSFTKIYALKDCSGGEEVTVNYDNYKSLSNIRVPGEIKKQISGIKAKSSPEGIDYTKKRIEEIRQRNKELERKKKEREALPSPPAIPVARNEKTSTADKSMHAQLEKTRTTKRQSNKKVMKRSRPAAAKNLKSKGAQANALKSKKKVRNLQSIAEKSSTSKRPKKKSVERISNTQAA